jgi:cobalt-precorrin 5A hydrolase
VTLFARLEDVALERFAAVLWISRRAMPADWAARLAGRCVTYRPPTA